LSPGKLTSHGWAQQTLKPGDKMALEIIPVRRGGRSGLAGELKRVNGIAFTAANQQHAAARQPRPE
jgi:hypothetical protein